MEKQQVKVEQEGDKLYVVAIPGANGSYQPLGIHQNLDTAVGVSCLLINHMHPGHELKDFFPVCFTCTVVVNNEMYDLVKDEPPTPPEKASWN